MITQNLQLIVNTLFRELLKVQQFDHQQLIPELRHYVHNIPMVLVGTNLDNDNDIESVSIEI
ncbi:hypothetical protein RND71_008654 [Anisodus tanguticus]|uniref:Uncharacterized protein n=1 Tax=Anisodus tanguticus TaxID=243964 RepID=A0AAE1VUF2_9SOLA|nr:hypothetical protein RND71_008654 [Anisodus tanguticus]